MNWDRYTELYDQLVAAEKEKDELCTKYYENDQALERAENAVKKFPELKKAGNGLLILSALLVIAEVILLFTGWNFSVADVLIIGLPAFFGLRKKVAANKELRELEKLYPTQEAAMAEVVRWKSVKKDLGDKWDPIFHKTDELKVQMEKLVAYKGKQWDIANIKIDNTNRTLIEEDAVAYMWYISFTPAEKLNLLNEVWCKQIGIQRIAGKATEEEYDRFNDNLRNSGSWILKVCRRVIQMYDLSISSAFKEALGGAPVDIPVLSEVLKKDGLGPAETDLERMFVMLIDRYAENLKQEYDFGDLTYFY